MPIEHFHKSHDPPVPYPTIQFENGNVHISALNGAFWDVGQVHFGIVSLVYYCCMLHGPCAFPYLMYTYVCMCGHYSDVIMSAMASPNHRRLDCLLILSFRRK